MDRTLGNNEKHSLRLIRARRQIEQVNTQIDRLLGLDSRCAKTNVEAAQAQVLVYLRRAERQVAGLEAASADAAPTLERSLVITWDELGIATHRLIARLGELGTELTEQTSEDNEP